MKIIWAIGWLQLSKREKKSPDGGKRREVVLFYKAMAQWLWEYRHRRLLMVRTER